MTNFFNPTINSVSKLLFGSMILLMVGAVALPLVQDNAKQVEAGRVVLSTKVARSVFAALQNARMQRGPTHAALEAAQPASEGFLRLMRTYRAAETSALAAVFDDCAASACIDGGAFVDRLDPAVRRVTATQNIVDADLRKPLAERQPKIAETFKAQATDVVEILQTVSSLLGAKIRMADAATARLMEIQELAWLARDGLGFERVQLVDALVAGDMSRTGEERYQRLYGQTDSSWSLVRGLVALPGVPAEIVAAVAEADAKAFKVYRPLSDKVHDSLVNRQGSPVDLEQITDESSKALDALTNVAGTAMRLAELRALDRSAAIRRNLAMRLFVLALSCLVGAAGLAFIQRRLIAPMRAITHAMSALAGGDETVVIEGAKRADEFGAMAKAFEVFRHNVIRRKVLEREADETKRRLAQDKQHALADLGASFENTISGLVGTLAIAAADLKSTANDMSHAAERTRERSGLVMTTAESAARNVAAASDSSRDLSAAAEEVGVQISQTATIAARAVVDARRSHDTISALVTEAAAIGSVVDLINQVASRTNLLALNATIEAARAGEAGRGFSVVASEVKDLANQTIQATVQIRARIEAIQQTTRDAASAIASVSLVVDDVHRIARLIASAAELQRAATQNIAIEMADAARGTSVLTEETARVRETANATGNSAVSVSTSAAELSRCSSKLDGEVRRFLDHLRAA